MPNDQVIYIHEDVIRGHHVYKEIWTPVCGEALEVTKELDNAHDRRAVTLLKSRGSEKVRAGDVRRQLSRIFWHFLNHDGEIMCKVTGRRKRGKGLEVPCAYKFLGCATIVMKMKELIYIER